MSEVEKIAAGLTKAQRDRLEAIYQLRAQGRTWMSRYGSLYLSCAKASSLKLVAAGLVEAEGREVASTGRMLSHGIGRLTPLGLAVRAHLQPKDPAR
jgi:hypothetical protein